MFSSTFPYNYFPSFMEPTRAIDYQIYAHTMYVPYICYLCHSELLSCIKAR